MKNGKRFLFDYEIIGEYYESIPQMNGTTTRVRRYLRKWFFVPLRKYRQRKGGGDK